MSSSFRLSLLLLCALSLSGCVNRAQADTKLAKGCAAAAGALLPDGQTLGEVLEKKSTPSPEGPNYRHMTIKVKQMDGWLEGDGTYECTFEEDFGFLNAQYTGSLYQLKIGEKTYGKAGNEVMGTAEDFLKITDAVRKAMYE
ncbi:MAG: putative lipoprotein [Micavibrio sp.]|nr:putative lipoprotein [Micavibrio sp.]